MIKYIERQLGENMSLFKTVYQLKIGINPCVLPWKFRFACVRGFDANREQS